MQRELKTMMTGCLPAIVIAEEELEPPSDIAEALLDVMPEVGHLLECELARARLLPRRSMPRGIVTINSRVDFTLEPHCREEQLKLVYPADHVADGTTVSIASPVGVALLGLRVGQSISWIGRYGEKVLLTVNKVQP
jgi:regulator of nucleoside diphosphate kinase